LSGNGLTGQALVVNPLASTGLTSSTGLMNSAAGRSTLSYLIRCALPAGRSMHIHATDDALAGSGEWTLRNEPSGITLELGHGQGDVAIRGPAARLLLVLLRRLPANDPAVEVIGDAAVLARWLERTPF